MRLVSRYFAILTKSKNFSFRGFEVINNSQSILSIAISFFLLFGYGLNVQAQAPKTISNSIGMKLMLIPKGTFLMGAPPTEKGLRDDECQHEVMLTREYYLGAFEVTQAQYKKVMGINPSRFQGKEVAERQPRTGRVVREVDRSNCPVEWVSWMDAVEFCEKLSKLPEEEKAGRVYRLPTEAEWEHACRAGNNTAFSFGESETSLGDHAWFGANSDRKPHPVGSKKPNAWGLYDMHGNVWEWCSDWYGEYPKSAITDPTGPRGSRRVFRGGSWYDQKADCRSAVRNWNGPTDRGNGIGFRVALSSSGIPE
jgi:formylglycine-generating enzyme required for sulfatase activity